MCSDSQILRNSRHYESLLLKDLVFYLDKAYHLEPAFLRVAFHFTSWVMIPEDPYYDEILKLCMRNAIKHFDQLNIGDIAIACNFSERMMSADQESTHLKEDFVTKLEPRVKHLLDSGDFASETNANFIATNLIHGL